jgi:phenylacetic acid degradation protein
MPLRVVDPSAYVHPTAVLIGDVIVGPCCYVGPAACLCGDQGVNEAMIAVGCARQNRLCIEHRTQIHPSCICASAHGGWSNQS